MKINTLSLHAYTHSFTVAQACPRSGLLIHLVDEKGSSGWGDIAPFSHPSHGVKSWANPQNEALEAAFAQIGQKREAIIRVDWTLKNWLKELTGLNLLPAVAFGLESALLSLLNPLAEHVLEVSALLMGTPQEILKQAKLRYEEGYQSAKLKIGHLTFQEAADLVYVLKDQFRLRIDVNRAWKTADCLRFFSQFALDAFDYVEEPFQNPHDLSLFSHPLALDESFMKDLSLQQVESLPKVRAVVYKPAVHGGIANCLPLKAWAAERNISLVLSSSFESDLGLAHIASMAHRLSLDTPVGMGTYHYLQDYLCAVPLRFSNSSVYIPSQIAPKNLQHEALSD